MYYGKGARMQKYQPTVIAVIIGISFIVGMMLLANGMERGSQAVASRIGLWAPAQAPSSYTVTIPGEVNVKVSSHQLSQGVQN